MDFRRKGDASEHYRRAVHAHAAAAESYVGWLAAHGEAWAQQSYALYFHSVAAVVMLHDGVKVEIRT